MKQWMKPLLLAFTLAWLFFSENGVPETRPSPPLFDTLSASRDAGLDLARDLAQCLTTHAPNVMSVEHANGGHIGGDYWRKHRRRSEFKSLNGYAPIIKNGSLSCVMGRYDSRIGDAHFPSPSFQADNCLFCLKKLRL